MRKLKSLFNILSSLGSYFFAMIFNFITQACIVKILGIEYNGINGIFTNILSMLSVAELGIGTTIIFKLYKPIAEDDKESIKSWMNFYKICYRIVALFITIVGLVIIPIVPNIVGKVSIQENIILLYIISLIDIILSYIMTYKRSLLYADQKNYIINIVHMGYIIFMNITQIILLTTYKNYYLFLIVKLIYRLLENIIINVFVNKKYPYINEKYKTVSREERKDVFDRIKALFLQKVSFVVNKGIDNIVISYFLGIIAVGYYTNYFTVVFAIIAIIYQIVSALTASVGNLLTENDSEKSFDIYKKINMLNSFLTGIGVIGFINCIQPFINVWIGEQYQLNMFIVLSFAIYIYADSIRRAITLYKEAAGICKEDKWMYVIMTIINLLLSIILCKIIGIAGVILGTAISYLFLIIYSYPKYIFTPIFKKDSKIYHKDNLKYVAFIIISIIISLLLTNTIKLDRAILQLIINIIISITTSSIVFIGLFYKSAEFKYYTNILKKVLLKIKN